VRRGAPAGSRSPAAHAPLLHIGHRGASARAPENTLASFETAIGDGADGLEFDVRLTRDGVPIVLHDATVDRTTSGRGVAAALDFDQIRRLDAGSWFAPRFRDERVPTLADTLDLARGRCGVNIELKIETGDPARLARAVAVVIAGARFRGWLVVSSFSKPALFAARAAMPRAALGCLASRTARGLRATHKALGLWSFHPHLRLATPRRLRLARDLGLRVLVWPVNDGRAARRLAAAGVDGIMTDDPARLRAWIETAS
jgi:glycerophosphoryl diester phosphodiesterase